LSRRSEEDGREELETKVVGPRAVEGNFEEAKVSPRTVMPEEEEEANKIE